MVSIFPTAFNLRFSGVSNSSWLSSIPAMLPTSVFIPVAITTPVPRPYITMDDEYAILLLSPKVHVSGNTASASFSAGTDSPVNEASWIFKFAESINRKSAGTISPSRSNTISPTTNSAAGITLSSPWRNTRAVGALIFRSASKEDCAFFSCTMPMTAFKTTIENITLASVHSCKTAEIMAATIRIHTIGSKSCSFNICNNVLGGLERSSFLPFSLSLFVASVSPNPFSEVFTI